MPPAKLFAKDNLVAWCIVPFDAKKRGPEERAAMLKRLGFTKFAYDYRAEHIPTFDAEMEALKKQGIELTAWWFPQTLNAEARQILDVLKRHNSRRSSGSRAAARPTKSTEEQAASGSKPKRPAFARSPRRRPRSAARSLSTTTAAGSASRRTSSRSSRS